MIFRLLVVFILFAGCQIQPTIVKEESVNQFNKNLVLVDTRSAFEFTIHHITGSVNLNSGDFLILKNLKIEKRILDPDIGQTIERLAKRGVSPLKSIVLISNKKDSDENKKWNWLMRQLGFADVALTSLDDYRAHNKSLVTQANPEALPVWEIKNKEIILKKVFIFMV